MDRRLEEEFSRVTFIMHHEERGDAESDQDSDSSELDDVSCLIHLLSAPAGVDARAAPSTVSSCAAALRHVQVPSEATAMDNR